MSAAERLAALDSLPATDLCTLAETALSALITVMNEETTLLRAGHLRQATALTADKTRLAQDYVVLARAVQRQSERLKREAPEHIADLRQGHARFATQMAENLRVLATAKNVTEDLLTDVAAKVGKQNRTNAYGNSGTFSTPPNSSAPGITLNRAS